MKSFLIVDDHQLLLDAIAELLARHFPGAEIRTANSYAEATAAAREQAFDLAILDVELRERSGLELVSELRLIHPGTAVIVLSMHANAAWVTRMLKEGVRAYVSKSSGSAELLKAIESVAQGEAYLSADITRKMTRALIEGAPGKSVHESLTRRELEIFLQLAAGRSPKQIADNLKVSPKTVAVHKFNISRKTRLSTPLAISRYCREMGFLRQKVSPDTQG